MPWFDDLAELIRDYILEETRVGYYVATVTSSAETFRRMNAKPEWLDQENEDLRGMLRIASPIIDVIYKVGTRVAVLSHDGIPDAGAIVGAVTDDQESPTAKTVWIRADLQEHEGHTELGATKSIRVKIGENTGTLVPLPDGTYQLEGFTVAKLGALATDGIANGKQTDRILGAMDLALGAFVPLPGDGGLALKAAYLAALAALAPPETTGALTATQSTKVKAE